MTRAAFAVESIRRWWRRLGQERHPRARRLLITADCGGSKGARLRLWKAELQKLARELGTIISLISATSTSTGLKVYCDLDTNSYPKGIAVSDAEMTALNIKRAEFHGEWNSTLAP